MLAIGLGMAAAPTGARAAEELPPLVTTLEAVTDGAADVVNTATGALFEEPRADITSASVEYAPGWIRMKVQTRTPTDPLKDEAWSDRSDAEWVLDTNGDGTPEYSVEFATDQGELYGAVFDIAKPEDPSLCDADSAGFSPEDGYTLVIDPTCIGNPKTLGYAVAMFIDTNPGDESAPMASDRVPDQGFTPVGAPVQSGEAPVAPPPSAPVAPNAAPSVTRGPAAAPAPALPVPDAGPARSGHAAPPAGAPGTSAPAPGPGASEVPAGAPAPAAAPAGPLARTGSASERHALFGLGILMLGAGLVVMTRPARRMAPIAR